MSLFRSSSAIFAAVCITVGLPLIAFPQGTREPPRNGTSPSRGDVGSSNVSAVETSTNNPWSAFRRAIELTKNNELSEAEFLFQTSANATSPRLVANAHYNLGCLDALRLVDILGDVPGEADETIRAPALETAQDAARHFRDCLNIDPQHAWARTNLELLRSWGFHIRDTWDQRDRDRRRATMDLLGMLDWVERTQRELRLRTSVMATQPDSQRWRRELAQAADEQQELSAEARFVAREVTQAAQASPGRGQPGGTAGALPDASLGLIASLVDIAARTETEMAEAASKLDQRIPTEAAARQTSALAAINSTFEAVAPFDIVLEKAIQTQQTLVRHSSGAVASPRKTTLPAVADPELTDLAELQALIASWATTLREKATLQLEAAGRTTTAPDSNDTSFLRPDPLSAQEQAIELTPRIVELASLAARDVATADWDGALPKQQEALRLLQAINRQQNERREQQPPQENRQQQQQEQDDGAEQRPQERGQEEQQENQKPEQQDSSQQESSGSRQEGDRSPTDASEDKQMDREPDPTDPPGNANPDSSTESDQESPEAPPTDDVSRDGPDDTLEKRKADDPAKEPVPAKDELKQAESLESELKRREAEALLRKVRQREREHRSRQLELQRLLRSRVRVEKDW